MAKVFERTLTAPLAIAVRAVEMTAVSASLAVAAIDVVQTLESRAFELALRNVRRIADCRNDSLFAIRATIDDFVTRLARAAAARTRPVA